MICSDAWQDYVLLDCSDGERLERWGKYVLIRPDPQVIWMGQKRHAFWSRADAIYHRSAKGGGSWAQNKLPESWDVSYKQLNFKIKPMGFKHTGLFPEQASNWDWMMERIKHANRRVRVLNLFAYTGGASIACAAAGAEVVHVDAARGMVQQARENAARSGLSDAPIRYIVDDCLKFLQRELRRGHHYEGIVMDPPSYGRGPGGEVWKLTESINSLLSLSVQLLSEQPLFFVLNSYTTGLSAATMGYLLQLYVSSHFGGTLCSDELGLRCEQTGAVLPSGAVARWAADGF